MQHRRMDWDRVAIHVETGVREDRTISQVSKAMRADGAPREEIRFAISQVTAARKWNGEVRQR